MSNGNGNSDLKINGGKKVIITIENNLITEHVGKPEAKAHLTNKYTLQEIIDMQTAGTLTVIDGNKLTLQGIQSQVITDITIP